MAVPGTTVSAVDLDGAVALEFVTTGDVAELQRRVAHMADKHAQHASGGTGSPMQGGGMPDGGSMPQDKAPMDHGMMGGGMMGGGMMGGGMMNATARAEPIPRGARLVLTPKTPEGLETLRQHVHEHAAQAASGRCPMMAMHQHTGD